MSKTKLPYRQLLERIIIKLSRENEDLKAKLAKVRPKEYATDPGQFCDCVCHKTEQSAPNCCRCTGTKKRGTLKSRASRIRGKGRKKTRSESVLP
jgi:hypothetical protein